MKKGEQNMQYKSLGLAVLVSLFWADMIFSQVVTVYTDKTEWENALDGQFLTEDFNDNQLNDGVSFVSTESGHINPAQGYYQDVLASESQNEPMTTWSFTPESVGYGGNWTLGGPGGSGNNLLVYIADFSLYVGAISNSYGGDFWGFISDTPFTSVTLVGGVGTNQQNYKLDDMVYSQYCPYMLAGDLNDDCQVDLRDFAIIGASWLRNTGEAGWNSTCDVAVPADGVVDLMDLAVLVGNWLINCWANPKDEVCVPK
jgi:hypothetical protein